MLDLAVIKNKKRFDRKESEGIKVSKKQTAGRDRLGTLAPKFAELFSAGLYPQLKSHLVVGKEHGITKEKAVEVVTQLAFYCEWPKAWFGT